MKSLFAVFCLIPILSWAQPIDTVWTRSFGDSHWNVAFDMSVTNDGNIVLGGYTYPSGTSPRFSIEELSSQGDEVFSTVYNSNHSDQCYAMALTSDDGYALAGSRSGAQGDILVVKLALNGNLQWEYILSHPQQESAESIAELSGGGYLVGGSGNYASAPEMFLIRLTPAGDTVWTRIYDTGSQHAYDVFERPDGDYLAVGRGRNSQIGGLNFYAARIATNGSVVWEHQYGTNGDDMMNGAAMAFDGGLYIAGTTWGQTQDVYVSRVGPSGDLIWSRQVDLGAYEVGKAVQVLADGGAVVVGYRSASSGSSGDLLLVRFASNGDTVWTHRWSFPAPKVVPQAIRQTPDGFAVGGWTVYGTGGDYNYFAAKISGEMSGSIVGYVHSARTQDPLAQVRVSINDNYRITLTNAAGWYRLTMPEGQYVLRYAIAEYCTVISDPIEVHAAETVEHDVDMGRPSASVEVTSFNVAGWDDQEVVFHVYNPSGDCPLEVGFADTSDWIWLTPDTGEADAGGSLEVTAHFALSALPVGDHYSEIDVIHSAAGSPYHIPVLAYVTLTAEDRTVEVPEKFGIASVYPNPFNATATIEYSLPSASDVELRIFDTLGRTVAEPVQGWHAAGVYRVSFDGRGLASGVYVATLTAGSQRSLHKLMLLK